MTLERHRDESYLGNSGTALTHLGFMEENDFKHIL